MTTNNFGPLKIVQTAYFVQDLDQAIERWHGALGLGPFVVNRHIPIEQALYRGTPMPLDISAAFVQAGDIQIELLCQHNPEPSAFRDMYGEGQEGLHHVAVFPDDHDQLISSLQARGFAVATELFVGEGLGATFVDVRDLSGHMLEVYRDNGSLGMFYKLVADAARNWDGRSLIVDVSELTDPG
jgi:catechol 2,3-dioxygenase-like lactoylglutathione lyase family enzyme